MAQKLKRTRADPWGLILSTAMQNSSINDLEREVGKELVMYGENAMEKMTDYLQDLIDFHMDLHGKQTDTVCKLKRVKYLLESTQDSKKVKGCHP